MITTSIRDILTGKFRESVTYTPKDDIRPWIDKKREVTPEFKEHQFYLFSDQTVTMGDGTLHLYVGQSNHPLWVAEHCAIFGDKSIGKLIEVNIPCSHDWEMKFFTKEEVIKAVNRHRERRGVLQYPESHFVGDATKFALIQNYNPCLNLAYRQSKQVLPPTYTLPQSEIPDGIIHKSLYGMDADLMPTWDVSYRAFDYQEMDNHQYKKIVYAPNFDACHSVISDFLGYKPENLQISAKERA